MVIETIFDKMEIVGGTLNIASKVVARPCHQSGSDEWCDAHMAFLLSLLLVHNDLLNPLMQLLNIL
jgi:hypothetical protein